MLDPIGDPSPLSRVFFVDRFAADTALPDNVRTPFEVAVQQMGSLVGVEPQRVTARDLCGDVDVDDDWFTIATAEHVARFGREWVEQALEQMHAAMMQAAISKALRDIARGMSLLPGKPPTVQHKLTSGTSLRIKGPESLA